MKELIHWSKKSFLPVIFSSVAQEILYVVFSVCYLYIGIRWSLNTDESEYEILQAIIITISVSQITYIAIKHYFERQSKKHSVIPTTVNEHIGDFLREIWDKKKKAVFSIKKSDKSGLGRKSIVSDIVHGICSSVSRVFSLDKKKIDIHIIGKDMDGGWSYLFTLNDRMRTDANIIMEGASAANYALERNEEIFYADKKIVLGKNPFYISEHDLENEAVGTLYCRPFVYKDKSNIGQYEFIVCIKSYGQCICDPLDEDSITLTKSLLRSLTDYLDVELYQYGRHILYQQQLETV